MKAGWSLLLRTMARQPTTHWTTCVRLVRTDGAELGLTKYARSLTIDGLTYLPKNAVSLSDIAGYSNLDADNLTAQGLKVATTITDDDLRAGRWDSCYFEVFRIDWRNPSGAKDKLRAGHIGSVTMRKQEFEAEMFGLLEAYGTSIGEQTSPGCRARLGDARCKVDLAGGSPPMTVTGTIASVTGNGRNIMQDPARTEPVDTFTEGVITFTGPSGHALAGLRREVKEYDVGEWALKTPLPESALDAEYSMTYGCNGLFSTCRDRFNNTNNFRGEPNLKGNDKLVQVGRET